MAIDTLAKRRRACFIDPIPDSTIEAIDRSQVSKFYYVGSEIVDVIYDLEKDNYITICGQENPIRFGINKEIDLFRFVPEYQKQTEFATLINEFQDFFNSMYNGKPNYYYNEEDA